MTMINWTPRRTGFGGQYRDECVSTGVFWHDFGPHKRGFPVHHKILLDTVNHIATPNAQFLETSNFDLRDQLLLGVPSRMIT